MRSVLVTGGSSGIGRVTVRYLAERGFRVFAGVRNVVETAPPLAPSGEIIPIPIRFDVTQAAQIEAARQEIEALAPEGLSGLVNAAGDTFPAVQEFLDIDTFRQQIEVNLIGVVAVTRAFMPLIRKGRGRIVNIGSMAGYNAIAFAGPYAASKYALEGLTDSLRRELAPWKLEVALIEPGSTATQLWEKALSSRQRLEASLGMEGMALYEPILSRMEDFVRRRQSQAQPPERVAEAIFHALTAARPHTRYRVGRDAKIVRALTLVLPDRALDAVFVRLAGMRDVVNSIRAHQQ